MPPNYAAQAAMKCAEPLFAQFLADASGKDTSDKEAAAEALRQLAGVGSRREFNAPDGAKSWLKVLKWFGQWRTGHGKCEDGQMRPPFLMGQKAFQRDCDLDDNPFPPDEGPEIDKPRTAWAQGFRNERSVFEHEARR